MTLRSLSLLCVLLTSLVCLAQPRLKLPLDNPVPTVTGITPAQADNGGTVANTEIIGSGFKPGALVYLRKAPATIAAARVEVVSDTRITCTFDLSDLTKAEAGKWNVEVMNRFQNTAGRLANGFEITNPLPTITSITPNKWSNDGVANITNLAGTNFRAGAVVKLRKGETTITARGLSVERATKISCVFNIIGAEVGDWDVIVENPGQPKFATLVAGFKVEAPPR